MKALLVPIAIAGAVGIATIVVFAQLGSRAGSALPLPAGEAERRILSVLTQARESGRVFFEVPVSSGKMLRLLTEAVGARSVVEVGTSTGYSGLWLCLALQNTGGTLTTFEMDHNRAATARKHFEQAGVDKRVNVVEGDAHRNIRMLRDPIDVVFIDADKPGYADYLNQLLPLVRTGGLIIADNIQMAPEYEKIVTTSPELETVFASGMAITLKKRGPDPVQASSLAPLGFRSR